MIALACMVQPAFAQAEPAPTNSIRQPASQAGAAGTTSGAASVDAATAGTAGAGSAAPETDREEIVVTGVRQSLATAQAIKRNSDTVVDAITAQDIGALPDRSVNEALQRVPGVAISRFAAPGDSQHFSVEGSGVVIRGLSYVRGEFNGRDTFAVSGGREIGFNDVPSELVGSVEVFKNLTADLIEGGISGTVNINTRKPFDQKEQLIYLSGSMNYGDLERRGAPSFVGLFSKQFELGNGGRFGVLASASYSQQYTRADSVFLGPMLPRYNDDTNGNGVQDTGEGRIINAGTPYQSTVFDRFPVPAGLDSVYAPVGGGSRTQDFNRKRIGFAGSLQYENADRTLLLTAQFLRTDARQAWIEHTIEPSVYYNDVGRTFPAPGTSFTFDKNGVFTSGSIIRDFGPVFGNNPAGCGTQADGSLQTYCALPQFASNGLLTAFSNRNTYGRAITQDQSFNIKWEPVDRLHVNLDGQYVNSKSNSIDDVVNASTFSGVNVDLRDGVPKITLQPEGKDSAAYFANPESIYLNSAFNNRSINDGDEYAFRGDVQYDVSEDSFLRKVRAGGRYSKRDQTVRTNDYNNWGAVSDTWTGGGPATFARLQPGDSALYPFADFFRGQAGQPPASVFIPDNVLKDHDALTELLRRANQLGGGSYTPLEDRGTDLIKGYFRDNEIYRNSEETWSGYVRADFGVEDFGNGMSLSGNIGVRYVRTKDASNGALTLPTATQVLPVDTNVDANGNALPPRYTNIAGYCAFSQGNIDRAGTGQLPIICTVSAAQQDAIVAFANGASFPDVATQTFGNWLPSFNLKFQPTPKLQMRFAASKAISRPSFSNLRNYTGVGISGANSPGNFGFQAQAQNPFLKPIEAKQFDLTAEWYFAKVGSLTAAVFYKDLKNIILDNYGFTRTVTNNGQSFDVSVTGPGNAPGKGTVKGIELAYQQAFDFLPGPLRGLGMQASVTYVKPSKIPNAVPANAANDGNRPPQDITGLYENLPLAGLSKYNANISGFYDLGHFYARVAYGWRSKFLLTNRDCCFPFLPVYSLASGQMDASAFYTVNEHFKIGVEAQNLLDTTTKTTFLLDGEGNEVPRSYFKSDRSYSISVRMTF